MNIDEEDTPAKTYKSSSDFIKQNCHYQLKLETINTGTSKSVSDTDPRLKFKLMKY